MTRTYSRAAIAAPRSQVYGDGPPTWCSFERAAAGAGRGVCHQRFAEKFARDFVAAWNKVMNLDRFDWRDQEARLGCGPDSLDPDTGRGAVELGLFLRLDWPATRAAEDWPAYGA